MEVEGPNVEGLDPHIPSRHQRIVAAVAWAVDQRAKLAHRMCVTTFRGRERGPVVPRCADTVLVARTAVNVWPDSLEEGVVTVTVDYTLVRTELTLSDVVIRIPLCVATRWRLSTRRPTAHRLTCLRCAARACTGLMVRPRRSTSVMVCRTSSMAPWSGLKQ